MKPGLLLLGLLVACHAPAPARAQLDWLLARFADHGRVEERAVKAHFTPEFLAARPAARLVPALAKLAGHLQGLVVRDITALSADHVVLRGVAGSRPFAMTVVTQPESGRIEHFALSADVGHIPRSTSDAVATARALAPRAGLLVAALDEGQCRPLTAHGAAAELPLASTFKLYVLLALVDRIAAGEARWEDELAVRDDWKSLPAGDTHDDPAGTRLTLRVLAERMIAISDNSATDHLLYFLGRDAVEAAMRRSGHGNPARNQPFLGTRELFWLKMAAPGGEVAAYLAMAPEARRAYLDRIAGKLPTEDFAGWTAPRHVDTLEWFASPEDLCRVLAALWRRGQDPRTAAVLEILARNPGLETVSPVRWPFLGFKGGSEPGVAVGAWLLRRRDGRWFVVVAGLSAPAAVDDGALFGLATGLVVGLEAQ